MKSHYLLPFLGLLTFSGGEQPVSTAPEPGWTAEAQCVGVHDGDTLTIVVRKTYRIRLLDCWAPEVTGPQKAAGIKSLQSLQNMALGRVCTVFVPEKQEDIGKSTSMSRFLGRVWVHGQDISQAQCDAGMACKTKEASEAKFGPLRELREKEDGN